jgi:uroporphyrinogen III methyltransferase/synthase
MVETRHAGRTHVLPATLAADLIARDFHGLGLRFAGSLEDLRCPAVRAAAIPATALPATLPAGIDYFVFPGDQPAAGVALLFREGSVLFRTLRRFYLPPVILTGAGPGGEGMLTVGAARAIARADVILADCLCGDEVLSGRKPDALVVPVGKRCGAPSTKQEEINRHLVDEARRGRRVVRVKGGDPCVFGRLEEETGALRSLGLSYRVLPGVGSASGAAAFIGQPLTVREVAQEIIFSTGRLAGGGKNPFPLQGGAPAIALYMSRKVLPERMADLRRAGYPETTPVVVVEKLGSPLARSVSGTIESIVEIADREDIGTPSVVLVGAQFHTPDHLPLAGHRVWLPAEEETAGAHRECLEDLGATCMAVPLIAPELLPVDGKVIFARPFDWVLFTSKKSPDYFFDLLHEWGFDSRWLPKVAAIGDKAIEKLRARGIEPDLIPPEPTRAALSSSLISLGLTGKRVLIPASEVAPDHVRESLLPHAGEVVRVNLYTLRYPRVTAVPPADIVLFSSETTVKSAVENGLIDQIRERGMLVGGIGPGTCERLERTGLAPGIIPEGTSPEALARAVKRYFANLELASLGVAG